LNFQKAHYAAGELKKRGFAPVFSHPFFNEFTVQCPLAPETIAERLAERRLLAGLPLQPYFPDRAKQMVVCVTEIKTKADIDAFADALEAVCR
jgi:glycine dehydrogenase subunit 1